MRVSTVGREAGGRRLKDIARGRIDMRTFDRVPNGVADLLSKRDELARERRILGGRTLWGCSGSRPEQAMLWFVARPQSDEIVDDLKVHGRVRPRQRAYRHYQHRRHEDHHE